MIMENKMALEWGKYNKLSKMPLPKFVRSGKKKVL